ncbi:DUF5007 domain-containing protein [Chitinophaga sp. SYP-B3965]|uniref:DUF5007 domain-containing protein n=1 Tax=Chitinophaga sp. SYP-B3965 TaxID=2663120 RepID=UPI001299C17F|nr:DUF5007 domain-containing protein [Chitinophaga sp. SYP-B3965]MRG44323.1 DUF5007 domain-containing protein [Chitinophaga sp. SYP-B3965]
MNRIKIQLIVWCGAALLTVTGCYKDTLPQEKDYMSKDMNFKKETFVANLGRMNLFVDIFNADYSTQPMQFALQSPRTGDKTPAPVLLEEVDTKQWKQPYSGTETSIAEIEAKRITVRRPILDLNKQNGQLVVWPTDSTKVRYGKYFFDVLVKNGAGERLFPGLMLDYRRPRPYEPYEFDDLTGIRKADNAGGIIRPTVLTGHKDAQGIDLKPENVRVYFIKTGNASNKLTFKFVNKDSVTIPISTFNIQRWDSLFYASKMTDRNIKFGFNRVIPKDSTKVTYDITNPFPVLAEAFAGDELAEYIFTFSRVSYGYRVTGRIGMKFSIHEPGEWTVVFRYLVNPKFGDD